MAAAERGSFLWMMFAITQVFLSIKLVGEVEGWITTLFGGGAAGIYARFDCFQARTARPLAQSTQDESKFTKTPSRAKAKVSDSALASGSFR